MNRSDPTQIGQIQICLTRPPTRPDPRGLFRSVHEYHTSTVSQYHYVYAFISQVVTTLVKNAWHDWHQSAIFIDSFLHFTIYIFTYIYMFHNFFTFYITIFT